MKTSDRVSENEFMLNENKKKKLLAIKLPPILSVRQHANVHSAISLCHWESHSPLPCCLLWHFILLNFSLPSHTKRTLINPRTSQKPVSCNLPESIYVSIYAECSPVHCSSVSQCLHKLYMLQQWSFSMVMMVALLASIIRKKGEE